MGDNSEVRLYLTCTIIHQIMPIEAKQKRDIIRIGFSVYEGKQKYLSIPLRNTFLGAFSKIVAIVEK